MGGVVGKLFEIAQARSGDKCNSVNVGVIAFNALGYEFIKKEMTINKIENYFENTLEKRGCLGQFLKKNHDYIYFKILVDKIFSRFFHRNDHQKSSKKTRK